MMKKILSIGCILALGIALVAAYFTNPTELQHKRKAEAALSEYLDQYVSEDTGMVGGLYALMGDKIRRFISGAIAEGLDQRVTRDDYLFFSLTRFDYKGENYVIGVGLFGEVHIFERSFETLEQELRSQF